MTVFTMSLYDRKGCPGLDVDLPLFEGPLDGVLIAQPCRPIFLSPLTKPLGHVVNEPNIRYGATQCYHCFRLCWSNVHGHGDTKTSRFCPALCARFVFCINLGVIAFELCDL